MKRDLKTPLVVEPPKLIFSNYRPSEGVSKTISITNPGRSSRLVKLTPPASPFFAGDVQFTLAPGQTRKVRVFFRPSGYQREESDLRVESGEFKMTVAVVA